LPGPQAHAVEPGAVGAAQVADAPAAVGGVGLGGVAADGAVVEDHLRRLLPADAQQSGGLPEAVLVRPVHTPQADTSLHCAVPCQDTLWPTRARAQALSVVKYSSQLRRKASPGGGKVALLGDDEHLPRQRAGPL